MATSKCAGYVHNPKRFHELALIFIGRYLNVKGTLYKGLTFKPIGAESLWTDIYVDAAFACGWGTKLGTNQDQLNSELATFSKSQTVQLFGYPSYKPLLLLVLRNRNIQQCQWLYNWLFLF